jgi:hypothetical protein
VFDDNADYSTTSAGTTVDHNGVVFALWSNKDNAGWFNVKGRKLQPNKLGEQGVAEENQRLDAKCWKGKHKEGTKIKSGVKVNNGVPNESVSEEQLDEKNPGLWANIHAKQNRIKNGSGEHMRKPNSKGAPKASDFKKSVTESSNYGDLDEVWIKNNHYLDDRSIDPKTKKPYIKFGPKGPTTDDDPERQMHSDTPPTYIYPGYKAAKIYADKTGQKVVRGGVSKWKVVPKSDPVE